MKVDLNFNEMQKTLNNIVDYSIGFIDGAKRGKKKFMENLGAGVIEVLKQYVDSAARMNPESLHHVYEWYQTGSPAARLFDLNYTISNLGLSINSTFRQSNSMSKDSKEPFYNKARIMELGLPVRIAPKSSQVIAFTDNGEQIFTRKPYTVYNPGGDEVQGSFEKIIDEFMLQYFKQSFIRSSGLYDYLNNPTVYKKMAPAGGKGGRNVGLKAGYTWITNARIGVENAI
jgi:hypothetical protein